MLFLLALPHSTDPEKCTFGTWFCATGSEDFVTKMQTSVRGVSEAEYKPVEREGRNFGEGSLGVRRTAMRGSWKRSGVECIHYAKPMSSPYKHLKNAQARQRRPGTSPDGKSCTTI